MSGFVVMGILDIVGVLKNFIQDDFGLPERIAGLIPSACYVWFLLLAVPVGIMMGRSGRRKVVVAGMLVSVCGLILPPLFKLSLAAHFVSIALLGIGATMLTVGLPPMLCAIVPAGRIAGMMSISSAFKALTAVMVPILIALIAKGPLGWQSSLPVLGVLALCGALWLHFTPIESLPEESATSARSTFSLLREKTMRQCFIQQAIVVGFDVGLISFFPRILQHRSEMDLAAASAVSTIYPVAKLAAALVGGVILLRVSRKKYVVTSIGLMAAGIITTVFSVSEPVLLTGLALIGAGYANMYTLVYTRASNAFPGKGNEISALMIMSLAGGAIIPLLVSLLVG